MKLFLQYGAAEARGQVVRSERGRVDSVEHQALTQEHLVVSAEDSGFADRCLARKDDVSVAG